MSIRDELAAALSDVPALTGYTVMPDAPQPGDAWPSWVSTTPLTACGEATAWHVWVVVAGADHGTVVDAEDPLIPAIIAALGQVGTVAIVEPVQLAGTDSGGNLLPCIRAQVTTLEGDRCRL